MPLPVFFAHIHMEAEPLYIRALSIVERRLGQEHPSTLLVRRNYAVLLQVLGRNEEAAMLEISELPS